VPLVTETSTPPMARFVIARETFAASIFLCAAGFSAAGDWPSLVGGAGAFLGAGFAVEEFSAAFSVRTGDGRSADFSLLGRGRLLVPESLIGLEGTLLSGTGLVNGAGVVGEAGMSCVATRCVGVGR
jgi:hypothetical protein